MRSRIEPMKKIARTLTRPPSAAAELFQGQKRVLQRRGGGIEQQNESHHEKIVWLPDLPHPGTRAVPLTWQVARTSAYP
jgi:hypothetical protein